MGLWVLCFMAAALVWNLPRIIADLPLKPVAAVLAIVWAIHVWTTFQAEFVLPRSR